MRSISGRAAVCLGVVMFAMQVQAQSFDKKMPGTAETYGTAATTYLTLQATEFRPLDSTMTYAMTTAPWGFSRSNTTGLGWFGAPVHLPEGAVWTSFEVHACDFDIIAQITFYLDVQTRTGSNSSQTIGATPQNSGCTTTTFAWTPITINNANNDYIVRAAFDVTGGTLILSSARVGYKLQVSPPPGTATFTDVPTTHPFYQYIEALFAAGITGGCSVSPPQYCPDAAVTRGQMAVFLSKALGLHWAP